MITPEAKKRMEEFIDKEYPTQWDHDGSCRYSEYQRDLVREGYQAADQANKELLLEIQWHLENASSGVYSIDGILNCVNTCLEKLRAMGKMNE